MQPLNFDLKIPIMEKAWTVATNWFVDLEPDNNFEIDAVWFHFDEDLFQATCNGYVIDLGFYGDYLDSRQGVFKMYVMKEHFLEGVLYECFESRSTTEIKNKMEYYLALILQRGLAEFTGIPYGEESETYIENVGLYSAMEKQN